MLDTSGLHVYISWEDCTQISRESLGERQVSPGAVISCSSLTMWPVARKWAMMEEQEKDSLEFHDMDKFKNSDEEVASEEGDDDNDAENGCAHKNYHFSPSLIKQRGLNSLHQVSNFKGTFIMVKFLQIVF